MNELQAGLFRSRLFRGVPEGLVSATVAGSETRELAPHEVLLRAGADNDVLYLVLAGQVSVHVPGSDRPHVQLGAGECVGELSLIDSRHVSADVVADEPTLVLGIDRGQLWSLIDSSADVARNLLGILAGRVRYDDEALEASSSEKRHFEALATVDGLTGLRNRRWLDDAFGRQLARAVRTDQPLSLLMIDIDHFKHVNDTHGHARGDQALIRVAQTLAQGLRPQDLLARYGGEEFAVLLPGLDPQAAAAIAERLRRAVQAQCGGEGDQTSAITVSVGVGSRCGDEPLARLLERADDALYRAKQAGRNCTRA